MITGSKYTLRHWRACQPTRERGQAVEIPLVYPQQLTHRSNSRGGQDRWAQIRAETAKLEGKAESVAETAKGKVADAVQEAKKTVS